MSNIAFELRKENLLTIFGASEKTPQERLELARKATQKKQERYTIDVSLLGEISPITNIKL